MHENFVASCGLKYVQEFKNSFDFLFFLFFFLYSLTQYEVIVSIKTLYFKLNKLKPTFSAL